MTNILGTRTRNYFHNMVVTDNPTQMFISYMIGSLIFALSYSDDLLKSTMDALIKKNHPQPQASITSSSWALGYNCQPPLLRMITQVQYNLPTGAVLFFLGALFPLALSL